MSFARDTSSVGQSAVVSLAATNGVTHIIEQMSASYSGSGFGNIVVEDVGGEGVLFDVGISSASSPVHFPYGFAGTTSKELKITVSGVSLLTSKVNVWYHDA